MRAGEEEGGGGVAEEGEDGAFGLLSELVVVGCGQSADYQLFHLVHPWRNSRNIIRRPRGRREGGGREEGELECIGKMGIIEEGMLNRSN